MYKDEFENVSNAAKTKVNFLKSNFCGYLLHSVLAGMYIGFGILLIFTIGGMLNGSPATKVIMGASFGVALSLVVIGGAELFTGNNLVMSAGLFNKKIKLSDAIYLWIVCWIGNAIGSVLLAVLYKLSGLGTDAVAKFMANGAYAKMSATPVELLVRGILCNILVCLAVWCGFRTKSDSAKLIMIFWCLFAFITTGFEHSIANMTLLTIGLLTPEGTGVTLGGWFYNLGLVTVGNMIGGIIFVAVPYMIGSRNREA